MGKNKRRKKKIKPHQSIPKAVPEQSTENFLKGFARGSVHDKSNLMSFTFRHLDENQGDTIQDWQDKGVLGEAMLTLKDYSSRTIPESLGRKFKIYGGFPPANKTEYKHPTHVPPDAKWASMHVNGRVCLGGHVVGSTFYIVFLDPRHRFWVCEKKHT
ncbi:MAG: hypothetical protein AAGN35_25850 [Bacteroidota bacterium]